MLLSQINNEIQKIDLTFGFTREKIAMTTNFTHSSPAMQLARYEDYYHFIKAGGAFTETIDSNGMNEAMHAMRSPEKLAAFIVLGGKLSDHKDNKGRTELDHAKLSDETNGFSSAQGTLGNVVDVYWSGLLMQDAGLELKNADIELQEMHKKFKALDVKPLKRPLAVKPVTGYPAPL